MTQTTPRPALIPVAPPQPVSQRMRLRRATRTVFEGSPGRLRLAGIGAVLSCLVFALLGGFAFQARASALASANANVAQLIRVQQITTELVKADSLLANGYLTYGKESSEHLAQYDLAVGNASRLIAEASAANADDAAELKAVAAQLTQYTAAAQAARDNNRLGYQVGTGYLRQAGALLRGPDAGNPHLTSEAGMLPTLDGLIAASTHRVDGSYSSSSLATWLLVAAALGTLGGLGYVQVWMARRTHRYFNRPLVTSSAAVLVILIVGSVLMLTAQNRADRVRDTSYKALLNLEQARIQAYAAKSWESLSLIYIGTGGNYAAAEASFQKSVKDATSRLATVSDAMNVSNVGQAELAAWNSVHGGVYSQAQSDWQKAAQQATQTDAKSLNGTFDALNSVTEQALELQAQDVDSVLGSMNLVLIIVAGVALIIGALAAVIAWGGVSQRLEEYR